jgi:hypothetical protein
MATHRNSSSGDLQVRKLTLIEWLARTDDETLIKEIESLQKKRRIAKYEKNLKPMTQAELIKRAKRANKEIEEGKYISSDELEREIASW